MQNHGLGMNSDKFLRILVYYQKYPKYLTTYLADLPKWPKCFDIIEKKTFWVFVLSLVCMSVI